MTKYMKTYYPNHIDKWRNIGQSQKKKDYIKLYRQRNKEHFKQVALLWKKNNLERCKKLAKVRYRSKREELLNQNKEWKNKNKNRVVEYRKQYANTTKGKEIIKKGVRKRRAIKHCIIEDYTQEEWLQKVKDTFGVCPSCSTFIGIDKLTLDHIYPISKAYKDYLRMGIKRVYTIDDIQPLCNRCNPSKYNKIVSCDSFIQEALFKPDVANTEQLCS
ncbi:hypothetical protein LCGC14_3122550 [marine sediment metagenome]|uniref:HNH domain-containing protein n=1 Tax=marine sediment metagenome TaxID=412755 RepID=A0A0F8WQR2_9ZZZZ